MKFGLFMNFLSYNISDFGSPNNYHLVQTMNIIKNK